MDRSLQRVGIVALALVLTVILCGVPVRPGGAAHPPRPVIVSHGRSTSIGPDAPALAGLEISGGHPGGSPDLAINSYGTILASWMDWSGPTDPLQPSTNGYAYSVDGGRSFSTAAELPTFGPGIPTSGLMFESDVAVAADSRNGTFWVGYQSQPTLCGFYSSALSVTPIVDNGSLARAPLETLPCGQARSYVDREWLASTPNGTLLQLADVPTGVDAPDLFFVRAPNGSGFQPPARLANDSYVPTALAAYNDTLLAAAYTNTSFACRIVLSRDGGLSWNRSPASLPTACGRAIDPPWGKAGLEWDLAWGPSTSLDVVYVNASGLQLVRSTDLGLSWSAPERLSGAVPPGTIFQAPAITVDAATGDLAVAWLDTRMGAANASWGVYAATSPDGGLNWNAPVAVSQGVVGRGSGFWTGDSIGVRFTPWGSLAVVWGGDDANGTLQTYFAQTPVHDPGTGNVSVQVVLANGTPLADAEVDVGGNPSRTDRVGFANFTNVAIGPVSLRVYSPPYGAETAGFFLRPGQSLYLLQVLGWTTLQLRAGASPSSGAAPLQVNFTVTVIGGDAPVTVAWLFGDGGSATGVDVNHTYLSPGAYLAQLWGNDSAGTSLHWQQVILVNATPMELAPVIVTVLVRPINWAVGAPGTFVAFASGGTGAYRSFEWTNLPPGCTPADRPNIDCTPTIAGNWTYSVTVVDSGGHSGTASGVAAVIVPPNPVGSVTNSWDWSLLAVGASGVVVAVLLVVEHRRRAVGRGGAPPPP